MRNLSLATAFLALSSNVLYAGAQEDADYIANVTVNEEVMQGVLVAMRPVLIQAVQQDLISRGIKVSDTEAFFDIVMDVFMDGFIHELRIPTAQFYVENFSASELHEIAQFYHSPTGKKLLRFTPAMMQHGAKTGQVAGAKAAQMVQPEIVRRIHEESLVIESRSFTDKLLEAFE
ncbi:DUF2059 domain-containing protein [Ruegeria faecimaris]|uniref:DUF2059 domain-containing protein n=1 Tax=Ruegeria faecimaris TaxID=686389 RepID=UPI00233064A4|nr:DUF2059 domain-containing protein [Ruegeria faecimaris]